MNCKIFKFLYRAVPIKTWRAFSIRRHFSTCPACLEEFSEVDQTRAIGITPANVEVPANLWENIEKGIGAISREKEKRVPRRVNTWKWAAAGAAAALILLLIPFTILRKGPDLTAGEKHILVQNREIIIHSIKIDNRPADTVYFQPGSSDRLIVWVKK